MTLREELIVAKCFLATDQLLVLVENLIHQKHRFSVRYGSFYCVHIAFTEVECER